MLLQWKKKKGGRKASAGIGDFQHGLTMRTNLGWCQEKLIGKFFYISVLCFWETVSFQGNWTNLDSDLFPLFSLPFHSIPFPHESPPPPKSRQSVPDALVPVCKPHQNFSLERDLLHTALLQPLTQSFLLHSYFSFLPQRQSDIFSLISQYSFFF